MSFKLITLKTTDMKNILLAALIFTTIIVRGQSFDYFTKTLSSDFEDGKIKNKSFTFQVNNINTFKYNVIIDNKLVSYNMDMPDLIKTNLIEKDSVSDDTNEEENKSAGDNFNNLYNQFLALKTCEQFYSALEELVGSELSAKEIILYKKAYYKKFLKNDAPVDSEAIGKIIEYYYEIIYSIKFKTPTFKPDATSKQILSAVESMQAYSKKMESDNTPQKLAILYGSINEQAFTVRQFIKRPDADEIIISIVAKPKNDKDLAEITTDIPLIVTGGWKIDFSSGIFLTNLVDQEYVNKPNYVNDTITGYYLTKSPEEPIGYGIAGYMHAYLRNGKGLNGSLTLGVGIDQNTQVKILPGISLLLGQKQRFVINFGAAIGKCKELSIVQDEKHLYAEKEEPIYTEPYLVKGFIGISYNLSK